VTPEPPIVKSRRVAGLYAITPDVLDTKVLVQKVRCALAGGARIVQYRSKSKDAALRSVQAALLLALCRKAGVPLIVNDDVDLALAIGADGLHLGRGDGDIGAARAKLGKERLLGASCYDQLELGVAALNQGADYVAFGSAFPSSTKPSAARAALQLYREAKVRLKLPIVAIGGITPDNVAPLIEAGVDAAAVISALFDAPDIEAVARRFSNLFQRQEGS
jgi:thiamine-phosphate pyrophosphorylase